MTEEHVLHGARCSCGWTVPLGKLIWREFDRHLLEERAIDSPCGRPADEGPCPYPHETSEATP